MRWEILVMIDVVKVMSLGLMIRLKNEYACYAMIEIW